MDYFPTKHLVKKSLELNHDLRDNDMLLITHVIREIEGSNIKNMSAEDLLQAMVERRYGMFESIRRARQKYQETIETLRGDKWLSRRCYQGKVWKQLELWDE